MTIDLGNNLISQLQEGTFADLDAVSNIIIYDNPIQTLDVGKYRVNYMDLRCFICFILTNQNINISYLIIFSHFRELTFIELFVNVKCF